MTRPARLLPLSLGRNQAHRRATSPSKFRLAIASAITAAGLVAVAILGRSNGQAIAVQPPTAQPGGASVASPPPALALGSAGASPAPSSRPAASSVPPAATPGPVNVYGATGLGMFAPAVAGLPPRVYVPDEQNGTVIVINPATFRIIARFKVGGSPEHVTPDWDLRRLYTESAYGLGLDIIDPRTEQRIGVHRTPGPYNLYFSPDGQKAIVVRDAGTSSGAYGGSKQLYFYDRRTWRLLKALSVPWAGADHLDFSADGSFLLLSTEYAGYLVKVDVARMVVVKAIHVGGQPVDVRLAQDGRTFYVTNQRRGGVSVIDAAHLREVAFIRTGPGAHGLAISRDGRRLYVSNRIAGSLSVIDFATRRVVARWRIGGSPDMLALSPDGKQLWISNRFGGTVSVVGTGNGNVIATIRTGGRPHGLTYFPEPGRFSIGHNGMYR